MRRSSTSYQGARKRSRTSSRRRFRALTWIWALIISVLLLMPSEVLPESELPGIVETALELAVHFVVFLGLAYLAARGYAREGLDNRDGAWRPPTGRRSRLLAAVLAYCVLLEILQIAVPGRNFEFADIAVGWLGALLGIRRQA